MVKKLGQERLEGPPNFAGDLPPENASGVETRVVNDGRQAIVPPEEPPLKKRKVHSPTFPLDINIQPRDDILEPPDN